MNKILRRSFGIKHSDVHPVNPRDITFSAHDLSRLTRLYPWLVSIAGHQVRPFSDLETADPDIHYYSFLRKPIVRCASHYQYQVAVMGKKMPFEEWIAAEKYRNFQTRALAGSADLERALQIPRNKLSFVGLVEEFDFSLFMLHEPMVQFSFNLNIAYTAQNAAESDTIRKNLLSAPDSRRLLLEANELDRQLYNVAVNEIFAEQAERLPVGRQRLHERPLGPLRQAGLVINELANRSYRNLVYKPWRRISYLRHSRTH